MRSIDDVAELTADSLRAKLPVIITAKEASLGLKSGTIGTPIIVLPYYKEPLALSEYPAVMVEALQRISLKRIDINAITGATQYRVRFAMRVWAYITGQQYDDTARKARRYEVSLLEALLTDESLGDRAVALDEDTYSASFSNIVAEDASRSKGGLYADFEVDLIDEMCFPVLGVADTIDATVIPIPVGA